MAEGAIISTAMRIHSLFLFTLPYFGCPVVSDNCSSKTFDWKDRDVELMDQCDIMKDEMTVHLDRLTARFDCLTNITVVFGNTETNDTTTAEHELHLDTSEGYKRVNFTNPLSSDMKCKPIRVSLKAQVSFPAEERFISFTMDHTKCSKWRNDTSELNFEKICSDKVAMTPAETSDQTNPPQPAETNMMKIIPLVFFSGVLIFLLLAVAVIRIWRRVTRKEDKNFQTEENDMYGTYSRGWEEDGEYGDGDVVEIIDRNGYYMN